MKNKNKFIITCFIFIILCFLVSASMHLTSKRYKSIDEIIELQNQKEVLEVENRNLNNIITRK